MKKNEIIKHYKDFFDLHAKGIALTEDDHLNLDWAEELVKNCTIPRVINWVAVTERMPPRPDEDYLVVMRNKNKEGGIALQDIKNFTSDGTWVGGNNWENVVAWAELPEPPCL